MKELNTVDLFCGAGGASTGLELALKRLKMNHKGLAINHMLKPSELAAAHSFPKDYVLTGNRGEQVKQIGNSVPKTAKSAWHPTKRRVRGVGNG